MMINLAAYSPKMWKIVYKDFCFFAVFTDLFYQFGTW